MNDRDAHWVGMVHDWEEGSRPLIFADWLYENDEPGLAQYIWSCSDHWARLFACMPSFDSFPPATWKALLARGVGGYLKSPGEYHKPVYLKPHEVELDSTSFGSNSFECGVVTGLQIISVRFHHPSAGDHQIVLPAINTLYDFQVGPSELDKRAKSNGDAAIVFSFGRNKEDGPIGRTTQNPLSHYRYVPQGGREHIRRLFFTFAGPKEGRFVLSATVQHDPSRDWQ